MNNVEQSLLAKSQLDKDFLSETLSSMMTKKS
jgi:hypothetical protein